MTSNTLQHIGNDIKTILNVRIFIDPNNRNEFFSHFRPAYEAVTAEPECRYFVFGENPENPGELWWSEGWSEDVPWLMENQLTKPYYKPYLEATESMFLKPRIAELLTPKSPFNSFKAAPSS